MSYRDKIDALLAVIPVEDLAGMHIMVMHDSSCLILNGGVDCTCSPDLDLLTEEEYLTTLS